MFARISLASLLLLVVAVTAIDAAENGRKAFVRTWQGQAVVLTRPLYSLVYSERRRFMPIARRDGRVSGLTVATPSDTYYQFEAQRDYEEPIIARSPDAIIPAMQTRYRRSAHLDEGFVQDVEPGMLVRYESGVRLMVARVAIERERLVLFLHRDQSRELATTLTVKLSGPLSNDLVETPLIERVLSRFLSKL